MSYSETLTITLPASLADIAASIGRALDPDVGGDKSFMLSEDEQTITCSTPCRPEFKQQALYMIEHPETLFAAVSLDYSTRWPDLPCPTLADCQAFCSSAVIAVPLIPEVPPNELS